MRHVAAALQIVFTVGLLALVWDVKGKIDQALDIGTMTLQQEIEQQCLIHKYYSPACESEVVTSTCRGENETFAQLKARHMARVAEAKAECPPEGD